jgi:hypothetical protein
MPEWDCSPNPERGKGEVHDREEHRLATNDDLKTLCAEWQRTLRLQDWDVTTRLARGREFSARERQGEVRFNLALKTAQALIIDPVDWEPDAIVDYDAERVLCHELLHLHTAPFSAEPDTLARAMEEQAIESIAKALVSLKRREGSLNIPEVYDAEA